MVRTRDSVAASVLARRIALDAPSDVSAVVLSLALREEPPPGSLGTLAAELLSRAPSAF